MNALARSVVGMAVAAGAAYLFDPVSGHRRRLVLGHECARAAQKFDDATRRTRDDLSHRTQDFASLFKADRPSDKHLAAEIRDVLQRAVSQPEAISVSVHDGHVILRGEVFAHQLGYLLETIRSVRGVRVVTDHLTARQRNGAFSVGASSGKGWPLTSGIFLGATACGLLVWGIRERKSLSSWGQKVWRATKREMDETLARAERAVETHDMDDVADRARDLAHEARAHIAS